MAEHTETFETFDLGIQSIINELQRPYIYIYIYMREVGVQLFQEKCYYFIFN